MTLHLVDVYHVPHGGYLLTSLALFILGPLTCGLAWPIAFLVLALWLIHGVLNGIQQYFVPFRCSQCGQQFGRRPQRSFITSSQDSVNPPEQVIPPMKEDDSPLLVERTFEAASEGMQEVVQLAKRIPLLLVNSAQRFDRVLKFVSGEGNTLIHGFLRILTGIAVAGLAVLLIWKLFADAAEPNQNHAPAIVNSPGPPTPATQILEVTPQETSEFIAGGEAPALPKHDDMEYRELGTYKSFNTTVHCFMVPAGTTLESLLPLARKLHSKHPSRMLRFFDDDAKYDEYANWDMHQSSQFPCPEEWTAAHYIAIVVAMNGSGPSLWDTHGTKYATLAVISDEAVVSGENKPSADEPSSYRGAGSIVKLRHDTFVARTEDIHDRIVKLGVADDREGVLELVLKGDAWIAKPGTKVRVIDSGFFTTEIRILSGPLKGRSGFVAAEEVSGR